MAETQAAQGQTETGFKWRIDGFHRSLTLRVILVSSLWAILSLIVIATVITALYRQVSHRSFDAVLSAHMFNLIASVSADQNGMLTGNPNLGDLHFSEPESGWYWSVEPLSSTLKTALKSDSLADGNLEAPPNNVPFDAFYRRSYDLSGPGGQKLGVVETEVTLGADDQVARFRVAGNKSELDAEIADFNRSVLFYLAIFGFGMVAINVFGILLALKPLGSIRDALARIRAGTAQTLDGVFPQEIAPLAQETNALIESNKRIIERSRKQVGNLAHSLKTPLAVMLNEGRAMGDDRGQLLVTQAELMQEQIETYLQKARSAAQSGNVFTRTDVNDTLNRLVRVMRKISPDRVIELNVPAALVYFAGERGDLEELAGNLVENAVKWSNARVEVSLMRQYDEGRKRNAFILTVEDDGPGIPDTMAANALRRGKRLDETKKGSGLGLSIVADMVGEYGGSLDLGRSELGGLRIRATLWEAES